MKRPNCVREEQTLEELAESIRKFGEDLVKQGPETCKKFLMSTGVYSEDGTLTENYK